MNRDSRSGDAGNRNRDVEGQVRGVGIRGRHRAENTTVENGSVRSSRGEQLNLTEVADVAADAADGGTDGLAHVTEKQIGGSVHRNGVANAREESARAGGSHDASGVVADSAGGRDELVCVSRNGVQDVGSAVVGVVGLDLTNETLNG